MTNSALELLQNYHCRPGHCSGKSQELFLPYGTDGEGIILSFLTRRLSSHDFMLGFEISQADEIQHVLSIAGKKRLEAAEVPTDLVAVGPDIDQFLHPAIRGNPALWKVVGAFLRLDMDLLEIIPRLNLTGSAAKQYARQRGVVYGRQLKDGLLMNDPLEEMIITYTDKAPRGEHDHPLSSEQVEMAHPHLTPIATKVMTVFKEANAAGGAVRVADSKFEGGRDQKGIWRIGDQVCTPYTSRIWALSDIAHTHRGQRIPPHDKDIVRWEMEFLGIDKFHPGDPEDCEAVLELVPSGRFITRVDELFLETVPLLTSLTLREAQHQILGIPTDYL